MTNIEINKIDVDKKSIKDILSVNYVVDYFQREYKWETTQLSELLNDLISRFLQDYSEEHTNKDVANYGFYYLGTIILSAKEKAYSIIDGQQRLTTLTLLIIYLNNLQNKLKIEKPINLSEYISNDDYGFVPNLGVPEWRECLEAIYEEKEGFTPKKGSSSVANLLNIYEQMDGLIDDKIKGIALKPFITWLKSNVVFSQIITYSDEDAYKIFEAMNDRGLSLTYTEMLKGYLLVKIKDEEKIAELNTIWKKEIYELNEFREKEDLKFFSAFLRAKYAETIRQGKRGASNEDFELIGSAFHRWVMQNEKKIKLDGKADAEIFLQKTIPFYLKWYKYIFTSAQKYDLNQENIFYLNELGLAESIYYPLLLAPLEITDSEEEIRDKISLVAKYLEMFVVFRCVNRKNYGQSAIRYTMYSLVKELRGKSVVELSSILSKKYSEFDVDLQGMNKLILHGQNKPFIKFLLARITNFIERKCSRPSNFLNYVSSTQKKPFEIEHIWCDRFEDHEDEFKQRDDFKEYRNKIGALLLVQNGFNQSYNDLPYESKLEKYYGQNLLAQTLNSMCYENDPTFIRFVNESRASFKSHQHFKKKDIDERTQLYLEIANLIWNKKIFEVAE